MKRLWLGILGTVVVASTLAFASMGGWAVVSVMKIPDAWVAGKPLQLSWQLRQHGFTLLDSLHRGCVTCHTHAAVSIPSEVSDYGPNLTDLKFPPDYLARFLADPSIKPSTNGKRMPNLSLREKEITPLIAFINADHRQLTRR